LKTDAEEVEEYAASAFDDLFGSISDALGSQISAAYDGGGGDDDDDGSDTDVLTLLAVLIISKIGISFSVGIDWSQFEAAFGWLNQISILAPSVPHVSPIIVKTVTFVFLLLIQPVCYLRMNWLSIEHRGRSEAPLPGYLSWLYKVVLFELRPVSSIFTPLLIVMWLLFWVIFIPTAATKSHMAAGFAFLFLGFPAGYLTLVNYFRGKTWEYVYLRCADVVRYRQYENLCLAEGSFVLFLFVAAYSFVMNFFIALLATWDSQTGAQNCFLIIGILLYGIVPLYYLRTLITDVNADRTFRIFREQLVSPFADQAMYMKLILLVESLLFSLLMLLGDGATTQLVGGLVVSLVFLLVTVWASPYEDDMETYSDIIGRGCVCLTLILGLSIQSSGSSGADIGLILISCVTTLWFLYTLDLKEILLSRFFLLLQLYAQAKASGYNKGRIRKLPKNLVRHIANSPIEFHVLSAAQKIHFATMRKEDFFGGKRIKELPDLGVTWLDLQQMGFTCASLRALGFSTDELMGVDKELDDMGDRSDIQQLHEDVYSERVKSLGAYDRATLQAQFDLAVLFKDMGEHVRGLELMQKCYKDRAEHLGTDDEDTLVTQQAIGEYFVYLNRAADGVELLQACLAARTDKGAESPESLDCMRALGQCLRALSLTGEAMKLLETRYLTVVQQTVGDKKRKDHPCTLPSRLDYATCLAESGCYPAVVPLKLKAIMNRQKTMYGAGDPATLKLMDQYAELLHKMGAHNESMAAHKECVSEKAATLGPNHTSTVFSKFALAGSLLLLGRNTEIERLQLDACLAHQETTLGETHPSTISSSVKLAALYMTMNKNQEALDLFRHCHAVRVKSLGKDHELTLGVASNLAATLESMEKYQEAKELYETTLAIAEEKFGKAHLLTTALLLNLGLLYSARATWSRPVRGTTTR
jgi:tetratricopeptide (TPR) repeat protein